MPGPKSERFPFLALDPALPKDAHQQAATDVVRVRIRDPKLSSAPLHVLVIASGYRRLEAQRTEAGDQVLPFDWTNGRHSSDFADLKALAVNVRNRGVIGNAEEHPSLHSSRQASRVLAFAQTPGMAGTSP